MRLFMDTHTETLIMVDDDVIPHPDTLRLIDWVETGDADVVGVPCPIVRPGLPVLPNVYRVNEAGIGIDMDLDVVRREPAEPYVDREGVRRMPGEAYIEDRDEWDEHRVAMGYPVEIVARLEDRAADLLQRVRAAEAPFDGPTADRWLERLTRLQPGEGA